MCTQSFFKIFSLLASKKIDVDIILQSVGRDSTKDISFTVSKDNRDAAMELLNSIAETIGAKDVTCDDDVAKLSIVGAGMQSNPGVAAKMFEALSQANVNIKMISTSEIKISVLINKEDAKVALIAVHEAFVK